MRLVADDQLDAVASRLDELLRVDPERLVRDDHDLRGGPPDPGTSTPAHDVRAARLACRASLNAALQPLVALVSQLLTSDVGHTMSAREAVGAAVAGDALAQKRPQDA